MELFCSGKKTGENDIFEAGNAQIIIRSTQVTKVLISKSIRKEILEKQLSDELQKLKSLPMQGTFIDIENADYLLSQNIFRNFKITDSLMSFGTKPDTMCYPAIIPYLCGTQSTRLTVVWTNIN